MSGGSAGGSSGDDLSPESGTAAAAAPARLDWAAGGLSTPLLLPEVVSASAEGRESLERINEELIRMAGGAEASSRVMPAATTRNSASADPGLRLQVTRSSSVDGLNSYTRLILPSNKLVKRAADSEETVRGIRLLINCLSLRSEYIPVYEFFPSPCVLPPLSERNGEQYGSREPRFCPDAGPILPNLESSVGFVDGVFQLRLKDPHSLEKWRGASRDNSPVVADEATWRDVITLVGWRRTSIKSYLQHLTFLMKVAQDPVCKSFCYQRCKHLEERFSFHLLFNGPAELEEVRNNCHRDFYNVRKVDTHVHHSACMTQKHLLRFIRRKYRTCGDEPVCFADVRPVRPTSSKRHQTAPVAVCEPTPRIAGSADERSDVEACKHVSGGDTSVSNFMDSSFVPSAGTDEQAVSVSLAPNEPCRPNVYQSLLASSILNTTAAPALARTKTKTQSDEAPAGAPPAAGPRVLTLKQLFQEELGLTAWQVSIDHLDVHAINSCFHRFDIFNTKYNPFGAAKLREVFLKTDNMLNGRYLAELTREVIDDLEKAKYQQVEWRVSIYGHSRDEWLKLARWILNNQLSSRRVRWIIQVPRLYHIYRQRDRVKNMGELLQNIFRPLIDAILRPEENVEIFTMLYQVVGWDSVDDESASATMPGGSQPPVPEEWTARENPPYEYWMYYMYENIKTVNALLQLRGMSPLLFRPHCGEAGSIMNLCSGALLADNINHGIMLRKSPVLMYLYYLWQIKIAVSPLSNNALFHEIKKSPFHKFFKIGHHISLSTDDPLMFHFTDESLLEEYSVMTHLYKFTQVDLCELARNSVLQSNFEIQFKDHWIGVGGSGVNRIEATNVPNIRIAYRKQTLKEEFKYLRDILRCADASSD